MPIHCAELRKDKAERAPGGVTPGDEDYYASVVGDGRPAGLLPGNNAAGVQPFVRPNQQQQQQQQQQPSRMASAAAGNHHRQGSQAGSRLSGGLLGGDLEGDGFDGLCGDDNVEDLMLARDDLMDSILQDEEEIIAMHRQQIEDSMDIVRR
jgi:kinesin family protein 2/24